MSDTAQLQLEVDNNLPATNALLREFNAQLGRATAGLAQIKPGANVASEGMAAMTSSGESLRRTMVALMYAGVPLAGSLVQVGISANQGATGLAAMIVATIALYKAVGVMADFEQQMARIAAASGATEEQMSKLNVAAREMAVNGRFGATEVAEGMKVLAQVGYETNQIIAITPGLLNLATAGELEMAKAGEIMAAAMTTFNIEATESGHVADVLAKAAAISATNVEHIGLALKYVGPYAAIANISLEETAALIATLSKAGIDSSSAGTGLRQIIAHLTSIKPGSLGEDALKAYGLTIADVSLKANTFQQIIEKFNKSGISANIGALQEIFDVRGGSAFAALSQNSEVLADQLERIKEANGEAQKQADIVNDTLSGAWEKMKNQISELAIALGDAGVLNALKGVLYVVDKIASGWSLIFRIVGQTLEMVEAGWGALTELIFGNSSVDAIAEALLSKGRSGFNNIIGETDAEKDQQQKAAVAKLQKELDDNSSFAAFIKLAESLDDKITLNEKQYDEAFNTIIANTSKNGELRAKMLAAIGQKYIEGKAAAELADAKTALASFKAQNDLLRGEFDKRKYTEAMFQKASADQWNIYLKKIASEPNMGGLLMTETLEKHFDKILSLQQKLNGSLGSGSLLGVTDLSKQIAEEQARMAQTASATRNGIQSDSNLSSDQKAEKLRALGVEMAAFGDQFAKIAQSPLRNLQDQIGSQVGVVLRQYDDLQAKIRAVTVAGSKEQQDLLDEAAGKLNLDLAASLKTQDELEAAHYNDRNDVLRFNLERNTITQADFERQSLESWQEYLSRVVTLTHAGGKSQAQVIEDQLTHILDLQDKFNKARHDNHFVEAGSLGAELEAEKAKYRATGTPAGLHLLNASDIGGDMTKAQDEFDKSHPQEDNKRASDILAMQDELKAAIQKGDDSRISDLQDNLALEDSLREQSHKKQLEEIQARAAAELWTEQRKNEEIAKLERRYLNNTRMIEQQKNHNILADSQSLFTSLDEIAGASFGKQSGAYKTLFAASKAFAIADATLTMSTALSNAWKLPWPANLTAAAAAASAMSSIIANVQSVGLTFAGKFEHGGMIGSGQYGLVGEAGPELVRGPAVITSARTTADMGRGGGSKPVSITIINQAGDVEIAATERENEQGKFVTMIVKRSVKESLRAVAGSVKTGGNEVSASLESAFNLKRGGRG